MTTATTVLFTIYCDDPSHAPKVTKVAMFTNFGTKGQHQGPWRWDRIAGHEDSDEHHAGEAPAEGRAQLSGDTPDLNQVGRDLPPGSRLRFKLACPLCGLALTVRDENLDPILNTLEPHAQVHSHSDIAPDSYQPPRVMRIPLSFLAARVSSK